MLFNAEFPLELKALELFLVFVICPIFEGISSVFPKPPELYKKLGLLLRVFRVLKLY
jgi:hypothetical protein